MPISPQRMAAIKNICTPYLGEHVKEITLEELRIIQEVLEKTPELPSNSVLELDPNQVHSDLHALLDSQQLSALPIFRVLIKTAENNAEYKKWLEVFDRCHSAGAFTGEPPVLAAAAALPIRSDGTVLQRSFVSSKHGTDTSSVMSRLEMEHNTCIPKIIHFIWAGGTRPMPYESVKSVVSWMRKNSEWEIYLWVDGRSDIEALSTYYATMLKEALEEADVAEKILGLSARVDPREKPVLQSCSSSPEYRGSKVAPNLFPSAVKIHLMQELQRFPLGKKLMDLICYEIDKHYPNFGASSDMLRYLILYYYGGAYFDTDVLPGTHTLDYLLGVKEEPLHFHVLYIDHLTQNTAPKPAELAVFSLDHIGNDSFISTKGNPFLKEMITDIIQVYEKPNLWMQMSRVFAALNVRDITIGTTGPYALREIIKQGSPMLQGQDFMLKEINVLLKRLRDNLASVIAPQINTLSWLKVPPQKFRKYRDVQILVFNTASFEAKYFRIFRYEDHIDSLLSCLQYSAAVPEHPKSEIDRMLCDFLKKFSIDYVQITGKYEVIENVNILLNKRRVSTLFKLRQENLKETVDKMTYSGQIESLLQQISESRNRKMTPTPTSDIIESYSSMIKKGIEVINRLLCSIDLFEDKKVVVDESLIIVGQYKKLTEFFIENALLKGEAGLLKEHTELLTAVLGVEMSMRDRSRLAVEKPLNFSSADCVIN